MISIAAAKLAAQGAWAAGKVWILLAIALAILSVGIFIGMRWESGKTQAALRERDQAVDAAREWEQRAGGLDRAVKAWEKRYATEDAQRKQQAQQAAQVLEKLATAKEKAEAEEEEWRQRFREASRTPDCAELMKDTSCAAFSGY